MKLIAIDSSTEACSVALLQDAEVIESWQLAPREHTQKMLPMVDDLLAQGALSLGQLDAIAFSRGPGSFTGLRVCTSLVQGLAFGADLPVVPISTLAALAQTALEQQLVAPQSAVMATLDARMDEVYWACYQQREGQLEAMSAERLSAPQAMVIEGLADGQSIYGVGPGFSYGERIGCVQQLEGIDMTLLPRASAVATLASTAFAAGHFCPAEQAVPTYLRDEVAWKKTTAQ